MSERKTNDSRSNGWSNWANKKNDWNISNVKRPKLEIQKNHLSQSSCSNKPTGSAGAAPSTGRGGSFRRTNSMPTTSNASPQKDSGSEFVDSVQEEFEANEAKALAEAAAAIELEMAQSQLEKHNVDTNNPCTSKKTTIAPLDYRNNGSSGFENLFQEEIAEEDVEEIMLLASQEIQASQNASAAGNSSFSQAYGVFSKGVDAHSSVLESKFSFKQPSVPSTSALTSAPRTNAHLGLMKPPALPVNNRVLTMQPPIRTNNPTAQSRNANTSKFQSKPAVSNPQAEAEVRRLATLNDKSTVELKTLKDSLRTKEGEAAILRSQLRQALIEREQQKSRSAQSAAASEQQFKEKLTDMEKELESIRLELQFQKAEAQTAKERYKILASNSERLRLVEPRSPGPSAQGVVSLKTPTRQRHVSGFLNRSTFEEPPSPRRPPSKRPRLHEEEEHLNMDCAPPPEPLVTIPRPETRTVGEQTSMDVVEVRGAQRPTPLMLCQYLSDRLVGLQLASVAFSNTELWKNDDANFDEKETVPTLSLLKAGPKSRQRCVPLDDSIRPRLTNCAQSLKHLMSWNDPTTDCPSTRAAICQIAEECTGILDYNLLLLKDIGRPSDKDLRDRDHDIISRGLEVVPLKNFDLLDEKQWYKEEYGVEMRRSLGILSEITLVSRFAASLVTGFLEPSDTVIKRHKFTELPEYAFLKQQLADEDEERYYLLKVLCDICSTIVNQKLTIAFNGVLAGILTLLKQCAQHGVVEGKSQSYFLDVIRCILIARPASTVLLSLVDLLTSVSGCQAIMRGLCTKCDDDDNVFDNSHGLYSFTKSSCAVQVLCIQLQAVTEANRWQIIDSFSEWLVNVIAQGLSAPSWILSIPGSNNETHAACCVRLTSTLVLLLSDAFEMLQDIVKNEELSTLPSPAAFHVKDVALRSTLERVMRRSIILLCKLVENDMFLYMTRVEGLYELLVQGIEQLKKHLNLSPSLERYLQDLVRAEQDTTNDSDQVTLDAPKCTSYLNSVTDMLS